MRSRPTASGGRPVRTALVVVGWALAALLVAMWVLRLAGLTSTTWEVGVVGVTPWILLPTVVIVIGAVAGRRWLLAGAAVLLAVAWVVWELPEVAPWGSAPAADPGRLQIFDANVSQSNHDLRDVAGEIRDDGPRLVTLEELTPPALQSLEATGVLARFPYRLVRAEGGAGGMGLWSTAPLVDASSWSNGGGQEELEAGLVFEGRMLHLAVVHVFAPVGYHSVPVWSEQLGDVAAHLAAAPRPLIVAGDFNGTADLPQFRRVLHQGLTDAAVVAGEGWRMTWPRNQAPVPPYLRLDHVLLSRQLTEAGYRLGTDEHSDHKPLMVAVSWARRARPQR